MILSEIKDLRWQHRTFKKSAERPVAMMGHLRGTKTAAPTDDFDVARQAVEISAPHFYSRAFTIDHR